MIRSTLFSIPVALLCALFAGSNASAESHAVAAHDSNEACQACSEKESCMAEKGDSACAKHRHGRHGHHGKGSHMGGYMGSHRGGYKRGPGAGADMQAMRERMSELKLSDQQKQDMAALMQLYGPRFKELAERGKADREALMQMAPDAKGYDQQVANVSEEAASAASEAVTLLGELQGNAYALLTPEQQSEYQALKVTAREKREEWQAKRAEARKGSNGKGCSHKARHGCARTEGAPETQP